MGRVADRTGIQFRLLNRSRGPAVQSPRAQADRALYRTEMRKMLENTPNLHLRQGMVVDLLVERAKIRRRRDAGRSADRRHGGSHCRRNIPEWLGSYRSANLHSGQGW